MSKLSTYINGLSAVSVPDDTDVLLLMQGTTLKKATPAQAALVKSSDVSKVTVCTQAEYDALSPADSGTAYLIITE